MKKLLLLSALLAGQFTQAQNLPACDSLLINCCTFDSVGPNTLTIYASNYSSNLFDYPSFVLFNSTMDTIAKETVTYFGIGQGWQPHTMDIVAPLVLPFSGKLNLYTLFYVDLACSFQISIPDTALGVHELPGNETLKVFPNPALGATTLEIKNQPLDNEFSLSVFDIYGREIKKLPFNNATLNLSLSEFKEGIYMLRLFDHGRPVASHELLVSGK